MSRMSAWFYCKTCDHEFLKRYEWEIAPWDEDKCPRCNTYCPQTSGGKANE